MKLTFKTKKQECDFIRALIKRDKFHIFPTGRFSNMVIQTTSTTKKCLKVFNEYTQVHDVQNTSVKYLAPHCLI